MGQTTDFLERLFGAIPTDLWILIWTLPEKESGWCPDVVTAARLVEQRKVASDVFVGVALASEAKGTRTRGRAQEAAGIVALWADVDVAADGQHPASVAQARAFVASCPLPPSLIVGSGHGLHVWWCLREPWLFVDDADRQRAAELARSWGASLQERARWQGWTLDPAFDLARVLRVPGTWNWKDRSAPVPVEILETTAWSYDPSDFEDALIVTAPLVPKSTAVVPLHVDLSCGLPHAFAILLQTEERVKRTWDHTCPTTGWKDTSLSAYDFAITRWCKRLGLSDQATCDVLICHRREWNGADEKIRRVDYYARTIAQMRASFTGGQTRNDVEDDEELENAKRVVRQEQLEPCERDRQSNEYGTVDRVGDIEELGRIERVVECEELKIAKRVEEVEEFEIAERVVGLEELETAERVRETKKLVEAERVAPAENLDKPERVARNENLEHTERPSPSSVPLRQIPVQRIVQYAVDPTLTYRAEVAATVVYATSAKDLFSQIGLTSHVIDLGDATWRKGNESEWSVTTAAVLGSEEPDSAGRSATFAGRGRAWLHAYVAARMTTAERSAFASGPEECALLIDETCIVGQAALRAFVTTTLNDLVSHAEMGTCIRSLGGRPDIVMIEKKEGKKMKRTACPVWSIPLAALLPEVIETEEC